jgi:hypothetical protein
VRTCLFHRTFEARALFLAQRFLASKPEPPEPSASWVPPLDDWLGSDDSAGAKEDAESFWPAYLEDRDALVMSLMSIGLTADFAGRARRLARSRVSIPWS